MKQYYFIVILVLAFSIPLLAADGDSAHTARQKRFIAELYYQKRYFDAIAETRRLLFAEKNADARRDYDFFVAVNYFLGGQYRSVIAAISPHNPGLDFRSGMVLSQSYRALGMPDRCLAILKNFRYEALSADQRYPLLVRRSEAYLACGLYRELVDEIETAAPHVTDRTTLDRMRAEAEGYRRLPLKSVPLAVALSVVIPGAGQMYAGKYLLGAISFLGIAAMAGGACLFYKKRTREISYTLIFFSSVLYLGNIYGAYNAAQSANNGLYKGYQERVRRACIPPYDPAGSLRDNRVFQ